MCLICTPSVARAFKDKVSTEVDAAASPHPSLSQRKRESEQT